MRRWVTRWKRFAEPRFSELLGFLGCKRSPAAPDAPPSALFDLRCVGRQHPVLALTAPQCAGVEAELGRVHAALALAPQTSHFKESFEARRGRRHNHYITEHVQQWQNFSPENYYSRCITLSIGLHFCRFYSNFRRQLFYFIFNKFLNSQKTTEKKSVERGGAQSPSLAKKSLIRHWSDIDQTLLHGITKLWLTNGKTDTLTSRRQQPDIE